MPLTRSSNSERKGGKKEEEEEEEAAEADRSSSIEGEAVGDDAADAGGLPASPEILSSGSSDSESEEGVEEVVEEEDEDEEEQEPKPVSSDSEDGRASSGGDDDPAGRGKQGRDGWAAIGDGRDGQATPAQPLCGAGTSRLFAPYRTLGVVSSGRPFHLLPHQSSQSAMLCLPIGDRFQIVRTDRLQPVLVSQAVPPVPAAAGGSGSEGSRRHQRYQSPPPKRNEISHCVTDSTLSVTVVAHGSPAGGAVAAVTLYQRTQPMQTLPLTSTNVKKSARGGGDNWMVRSMLHLGRIKLDMAGGADVEKEGRKENAAVVAVVLGRIRGRDGYGNQKEQEEGDDGVPVVGEDDDDDDDDDSSSKRSSVDNDDDSSKRSSLDNDDDDSRNGEEGEPCFGQVVVLLATRTTLQIHRRIRLPSVAGFRPMAALHPSTYVNKMLIGGVDDETGSPAMCLVNIRSSKVVHVFQCVPRSDSNEDSGDGGEEILTIEQSPAVDTVAVGTSRGAVHLVNLRHDKLLFTLRHKSAGGRPVAITSISFRTDGSAMRYAVAPMAVGRSDGKITVWDLTPPEDSDAGRTILTEMDRAHAGGIAMLQYLPQEPLLVSIGTRSNAVVIHIFDNPNHSGRVLRQRRGHTAPPTTIRYLHPGSGSVLVNDGTDASSCQILSTGGPDRTLRVFSTARSVLDKEYSQGSGLEKKARKLGLESTAELLLPPVKSIARSDCRSRDWGDLVTIHEGHSLAYVWSTKRGAQSGPLLKQPRWNVSAMKTPPPTHTHATSVTMSACGNFALVGTRGGTIYKYNVQSGRTRGSYPRDATESPGSNGMGKHRTAAGDIRRTMKALEKTMKMSNRESNLDRKDVDADQEARLEQLRRMKLREASHAGFAVMGLAVDSVNKTLISVGADSKLVLWNFATHAPHKKSPYTLPRAATRLCHIRESDLAAIALDDYSIVLFDCTSLMIVRRFGVQGGLSSHKGPITDLGFSPDGRTLYTSSLDSTIRVFDCPTNSCVDWLRFKAPPTSLTVSPTGEFLATTHLGQLGISVWSDRSYYQTVHMDGTPLLHPAEMDEPVPVADNQSTSQLMKPMVTNEKQQQVPGLDKKNADEDEGGVPEPKYKGLVTMSGLAPAHWKGIFHLELIRERNRTLEPPTKTPTAPFFLQWRSGEALGGAQMEEGDTKEASQPPGADEEEWAAAWSDDDDAGELRHGSSPHEEKDEDDRKRVGGPGGELPVAPKRPKITHYRSRLASLLQQCSSGNLPRDQRRFQQVTDYISTLGPSAIDVSLSSLCNGLHDVDEGLPLLLLTCEWLIEACHSCERFEVINAYLHRFLHIHAPVIAEIDKGPSVNGKSDVIADSETEKRLQLLSELSDSVSRLKVAQQAASTALDVKLKNTLCLLRHFSRMV